VPVIFEFFLGARQPIWVSDLSNLTVFGLFISSQRLGSTSGSTVQSPCPLAGARTTDENCGRVARATSEFLWCARAR
jgi:hypothetical protein